MAKSSFVTHTPVLNIPLPSRLYTILCITNLILYSHLFTFTFSIPITPTDTENYLPSDDPNITNLMVFHYDCDMIQHTHMFTLLIHNILTTLVFHVLKYILQHKHSVVNQILFIPHNIQIFLLHTLRVSICIQDNLILTP